MNLNMNWSDWFHLSGSLIKSEAFTVSRETLYLQLPSLLIFNESPSEPDDCLTGDTAR